ncbi:MAG: peptidoglycan DD-metalloendopeptidase family protein [Rickettsiales bacterium]|jgi:murein DD-endopeptidase MepM/ murein hydrolase activator NlpD|nr:peptidoglycan DD-metalloendopeptidase family protein [Rickettsiales bacterium]
MNNVCWECAVLTTIYTSIFSVADRVYEILRPIALRVSIVAFAFWFLWYFWTNFIASQKNVDTLAKDVMKKLVAFAFVFGMLSLAPREVFRWTAEPVMSAGSGLARWILAKTYSDAEVMQHGRHGLACEEPKEGEDATLADLVCITKEFANSYDAGFQLGWKVAGRGLGGIIENKLLELDMNSGVGVASGIRKLITVGLTAIPGAGPAIARVVNIILDIVGKILMKIGIILNSITLLMGMAVLVAFAYVAFAYLSMIIDIAIKLAMVAMLLPITIAAWMFDNTRGKLSAPLFFNFVKCSIRIVFLAIAMSISTYLLNMLMTSDFSLDNSKTNVRTLWDKINEVKEIKPDGAAGFGAPLEKQWPITSPYGQRERPEEEGTEGASREAHTGTDFGVPVGTPVLATQKGRVVQAGNRGNYGLAVEIRHDGQISTMYGHLSEVLVANGAEVEAGQTIGLSGNTGRSTGPHLHYEMRRNGAPISANPLSWAKWYDWVGMWTGVPNIGIITTFLLHSGAIVAIMFVCMACFMLLGASIKLADDFSGKIASGVSDGDVVLSGVKQMTISTIRYIQHGVSREVSGYLKGKALKKELTGAGLARRNSQNAAAAAEGLEAPAGGGDLGALPLDYKVEIYQQQNAEPSSTSADSGSEESPIAEGKAKLAGLEKQAAARADFVKDKLEESEVFRALSEEKKAEVVNAAISQNPAASASPEAAAVAADLAPASGAAGAEPFAEIKEEWERGELIEELKGHKDVAEAVANGTTDKLKGKALDILQRARREVENREYKNARRLEKMREEIALAEGAIAGGTAAPKIAGSDLLRELYIDESKWLDEKSERLDPLGDDWIERKLLKRQMDKLNKKIAILNESEDDEDMKLEVEKAIKAFHKRQKYRRRLASLAKAK